MAFVDKFNQGMQRVMALRSPEIMRLLPQVEAMTFDARVAMVQRGRGNLASLIKGWDKFSPIMVAQGMERGDVRRRLKGLKSAKNHLDDALRLADPKLPTAFKDQADAAFNVLVACFLRDAENLQSVLTGPKITAQNFSQIVLPAFDNAVIEAAKTSVEEEVVDHAQDAEMDVSSEVRTEPEGEVSDVISNNGGDRVSA